MDFNYNIPEKCSHIKIDIGLSYNAPQSQVWLANEPNLMVFGFEPNPDLLDSISKGNIQKRHRAHGEPLQKKYIDEKRFSLVSVALSDVDKVEQMNFYINKNDCGTSSLFKHDEKYLGSIEKVVQVNVCSLKMFFDNFPWERFEYIDYIKIDAQGSDLNILKSAGKYLQERVVYVTAEPHGYQYYNAETCNTNNIINYMLSQNFIQINHPNTQDPTFVNSKFIELAKKIYINQI
jgi:FkbM family methyltransferase